MNKSKTMFGKIVMSNFIKQIQQIQEKIQRIEEENLLMEVTGESGAGLVKVTINGEHNCRCVRVDPCLLKDDKDMLEDLIAAAFNDAVRRIAKTKKDKMVDFSSSIPLPPGFKIPL